MNPFYFKDQAANNINDLYNILKNMTNSEFSSYNNSYKNDFFNWITYELNNHELGQKILFIKEKEEFVNVLKEYLTPNKFKQDLEEEEKEDLFIEDLITKKLEKIKINASKKNREDKIKIPTRQRDEYFNDYDKLIEEKENYEKKEIKNPYENELLNEIKNLKKEIYELKELHHSHNIELQNLKKTNFETEIGEITNHIHSLNENIHEIKTLLHNTKHKYKEDNNYLVDRLINNKSFEKKENKIISKINKEEEKVKKELKTENDINLKLNDLENELKKITGNF